VKTLILFNTSSMSDVSIEAVREFVTEGGTLIASGNTSLFDEHGRARSDFGLHDVFGFSHAGEQTGPGELKIDKSSVKHEA